MFPFSCSEVLLGLFLYLVYQFLKVHRYWKRRNIPHSKFTPILGDCSPIINGEKDFADLAKEIYDIARDNQSHVAGFWTFNKPSSSLRDPDLIKKMLVQQFDAFSDRVQYSCKEEHPHFGILQSKNPEWKTLRETIVPRFSTEKTFFEKILDNSEKLVQHIKENGEAVDILDICTRYAEDNMSVCFLNRKGQSLIINKGENKDIVPRKEEYSIIKTIQMAVLFIIPEGVYDFSSGLMKGKSGKIIEELLGFAVDKNVDDGKNTEAILTSFKSSLEAISTSIALALYYLSKDIALQNKLKEEISSAKSLYGGKITHDSIGIMTCLDNIYKETLRLHPVVPYLDRRCTRNNRLGPGLFVKKGDRLFVSLEGLHSDSQYWENPEKFDPERFSKDYIQNAFIPFGTGPRSCIGQEFAILQSKVVLAQIISNFTVKSICEDDEYSKIDLPAMLKLKFTITS